MTAVLRKFGIFCGGSTLLLGIDRGTVKAIDLAMMEKVQTERPLDGIDVLGFDEIAAGRGQSYWTMICAPEGPRGPELLGIVEGKHLKPFWDGFGKERAQKVTHAVMDMWPAFRKGFLSHCLKGQVIYDKFHGIRHLLEAVNEVRKQEFKRLGGAFKSLLPGKKFVLLARRSNLKPEAKKALSELLLVSPRLLKAHVLKESFDHLWDFRSRTWAAKFFRKRVDALKWSRLTPLKRFATMVEAHLDGILSYCDRKVPLGYVEPTNQKAKNAIRRAYGYRDQHFKKLKIIQSCTSWMNDFQPWSRYPLLIVMSREFWNHKKRRLHEGGVGPEMRSPAGLIAQIMAIAVAIVKPFTRLGGGECSA